MRNLRLFLVLLLLDALLCRGAEADLTETSADADFAALNALRDAFTAKSPSVIGGANFLTIIDQHLRAMRSAILAFYIAHPTDPRRWHYVNEAFQFSPTFVKEFGPDVDTRGPAAIITDEATKEVWTKQLEKWTQEMLAATDVPPDLREQVEWRVFARDFRATTAAKDRGEAHDFSDFRARFDAHLAKYVQSDRIAARASDYLGALEAEVPGASAKIWNDLLNSSSAPLRERAAERIKFLELRSKPLEMAFTAADGRRVDLKTLRGKVVLIDFWATWCGPCIAELPNIKKVYAAYHGKGFEILGISLENGKLAPEDTPDQVVAKLDAAKKILMDFTSANEMPWPQYFDGKFWGNEISAQFAVKSIPAMFLLDQDGKVVNTRARGEALEREVRRLLDR